MTSTLTLPLQSLVSGAALSFLRTPPTPAAAGLNFSFFNYVFVVKQSRLVLPATQRRAEALAASERGGWRQGLGLGLSQDLGLGLGLGLTSARRDKRN